MKIFLAPIPVIVIAILAGSCSVKAENVSDAMLLRGNARYSVRPEYSRFLLFFRGNVHSSGVLNGNTLTVSVSDIQSAVTLNGANLAFHTGLVAHAVVDRITNGKTTVTLTLRDGFKNYRVVSHEGHEAIWIDILPTESLVERSLRSSSRIPLGRLWKNTSRKTTIKTPIVDIPAMVRKQLANDQNTRRVKDQSTSRTEGQNTLDAMQESSTAQSAAPSVWLLLISLFLLATGISGIMYLAKQKEKKLPITAHQPEPKQQPVTLPLFPNYTTDGSQASEKKAKERVHNAGEDVRQDTPMPDEEEELASTLAKQYRRNRGDIEFALKLRENEWSKSPVKNVGKNKTRLVINSSRLSAAKKLGVGTGELELVERLKNLESSQLNQEGV